MHLGTVCTVPTLLEVSISSFAGHCLAGAGAVSPPTGVCQPSGGGQPEMCGLWVALGAQCPEVPAVSGSNPYAGQIG